jgi:hypothetical protein
MAVDRATERGSGTAMSWKGQDELQLFRQVQIPRLAALGMTVLVQIPGFASRARVDRGSANELC